MHSQRFEPGSSPACDRDHAAVLNEECFQTAKYEAGLDRYQVRSWRAWHAHITLGMLAAAYLAATHAREAKKGDPVRAPTG